MKINVHSILKHSTANGPGNRYVIWVQGCSLKCEGCWNPETWTTQIRQSKKVEEIFQDIQETHQQNHLEGVTISGGEPFDQAGPLITLAEKIQQAGFNLLIFTGHVLEDLITPEQKRFLNQIDWLIDGPFISDQRTEDLLLRGSGNQRLHYLTNRAYPLENASISDCEILIDANGKMIVSGIPNRELVQLFRGDFDECLY